MSSRFSLKTSVYGSHHQGGPSHLVSDPDNNDKTRRGSKIRFSITSWSLIFQRLLLNTHAKRDTLLPISACLLVCFGIILYNLLCPNVVDQMARRSISQQDLHRYYSTTDHPILLRFDNPLDNLPQEVRQYHHTTRKNEGWTENDEIRQQDLWSEEKYEDEEYLRPEPYEGMPECTPMHEWQTTQYPTCTIIHEQALDDEYFGKFLASGAFRQTFEIYDYETNSPVAMKTIRDRPEENLFTPYYMERHRIDALIYERTSASPWITDIYGFCGYSGLFEFAGGGTLEDALLDREEKDLKPLSRLEKLSLAVEATSAIVDLHTIDSINGYAAMFHGDVKLNQFVRIGSRYKLNDFNRGHLLYWDAKEKKSCPYAWEDGNSGTVSISSKKELYAIYRTKSHVTLFKNNLTVPSPRGIQS